MLNLGNTVAGVESIKCLVVGDLNTGKTQLCKTMLGDDFDPGYLVSIEMGGHVLRASPDVPCSRLCLKRTRFACRSPSRTCLWKCGT